MAEFNKDEFVTVLTKIQKMQELQESIYSMCRKVDPSSDVGFYPTLETSLVDALIKMYNDEADDWICWWIYETDCGENHAEILSPEGTSYVIDSPEKLYYLLKNEWDKIE